MHFINTCKINPLRSYMASCGSLKRIARSDKKSEKASTVRPTILGFSTQAKMLTGTPPINFCNAALTYPSGPSEKLYRIAFSLSGSCR
jgi:hypothetical protein